jgi:hypothetical protein
MRSIYLSKQGASTGYALSGDSCRSEKIYRLKEDQAFSLSLELGRREKIARYHRQISFLSPSPPPTPPTRPFTVTASLHVMGW